MKLKIILYILSLAMAFSTCKKKDEGYPAANEIWLQYKIFTPQQILVPIGTTVTFINKDNGSHKVISGSLFYSGLIKPGDTYTYTFTTAGTYYVNCPSHSQNNQQEQAAIRVQ